MNVNDYLKNIIINDGKAFKEGDVISTELWNQIINSFVDKINGFNDVLKIFDKNIAESVDTVKESAERVDWLYETVNKHLEEWSEWSENYRPKFEDLDNLAAELDSVKAMHASIKNIFVHYGEEAPTNPDVVLWVAPTEEPYDDSGGEGGSGVGKPTGEGGEIFNLYEDTEIDLGNINGIPIGKQTAIKNEAPGRYAHSEGVSTVAQADASHAEGFGTRAEGEASHTEGGGTVTTGMFAHSEGRGARISINVTKVSGNVITIESNNTSYLLKTYELGVVGKNTVFWLPSTNSPEQGEYFYAVSVDKEEFLGGVTSCSVTLNRTPTNISKGSTLTAFIGAALSPMAHVEGNFCNAVNINATKFYDNQDSDVSRQHAEGSRTLAVGNISHTEGLETVASGAAAHAEGAKSESAGWASHAEGSSKALETYTHAEGNETEASYMMSHSEGYKTKAKMTAAHAEGIKTEASGHGAHAEGVGNIASGCGAHAEGGIYNQGDDTVSSVTVASGHGSHSEGLSTKASGRASHAEGNGSKAEGEHTHAEGYMTNAKGKHSHSECWGTSAVGNMSHAENQGTVAEGVASHAEGQYTYAKGDYSHAEGAGALSNGAADKELGAHGKFSHSEGERTLASGTATHAEGLETKATSSYAHAEGCRSIASGMVSHAEGYQTEARGNSSHAGGQGTIATGVGQYVVGLFNEIEDDALFIVGDGTTNETRHNAFVVYKDESIKIGDTKLSPSQIKKLLALIS